MDKFGKKELTERKTFTENTWYDWHDWLINYIPEPIKKTLGGIKDEIIIFLKPTVIVNQNVSKLCMEVERNNLKKT